MSDLQCAARVFVVRHGEADSETEPQCDHGGTLSPRGREQSRALGESLAGERIARVWSSPMARAVQTAEIAAATLGCDVTVREGLREVGVGAHGAESGAEMIGRVTAVLDEIADLHRGESVLVVSHGGAICTGVPALAGNLHPAFPEGRSLPSCGIVELAGDADGWRAVAWLDEPLASG